MRIWFHRSSRIGRWIKGHKNTLLFATLLLTIFVWVVNFPFLPKTSEGTKIVILVISTVLLIPSSIAIAYMSFIESKDFRSIFLTYFMLTFLVILMFGFAYNTVDVLSRSKTVLTPEQITRGNYLKSSNGIIEGTAADYLYFSSVTYFSLGYGDIYPNGNWMRFLSQLEVFFGFVINIFSAGTVISNFNYNRIKG